MQIPSWVLEGSNGATAFALLFVVAFQISFLVAASLKFELPDDGRSFYRQMKPLIALTVMSSGFLLRFADIWAQRFSDHYAAGLSFDPWVSILLHVVGTAASIIGVLCWLRVSMPKWFGRRGWLVIVALCALVFIYPALF